MKSKLIRPVVGALICAVSAFILSGCGSLGTIRPSSVRSIPAEIELKLSPGDSRQEVRSLLGQPLIDSRRHGVEVYQLTGRDIKLHMAGIIPLPGPGDMLFVYVLVVYDGHARVKDIASGLWEYNRTEGWISAGGYSLLNIIRNYPPSILVGPPISRRELTTASITGGRCVLYLLLNDYFMGELSLDGKPFTDLKGLPRHYWVKSEFKKYATFNGLFIRKEISPGHHVLSVYQRFPKSDFKGAFLCRQGESLYAQLEVQDFTQNRWWSGRRRLEGEITVNKDAPRRVHESSEVRPVLWIYDKRYKDMWYVPLK